MAELIGIIASDKADYDAVCASGGGAPAAAAPAAEAAAPAAPAAAGGAPAPAAAAPAGDSHVVVIGGGPGGYPAAIRVAQLGGKVTIIEKDEFGGTYNRLIQKRLIPYLPAWTGLRNKVMIREEFFCLPPGTTFASRLKPVCDN